MRINRCATKESDQSISLEKCSIVRLLLRFSLGCSTNSFHSSATKESTMTSTASALFPLCCAKLYWLDRKRIHFDCRQSANTNSQKDERRTKKEKLNPKWRVSQQRKKRKFNFNFLALLQSNSHSHSLFGLGDAVSRLKWFSFSSVVRKRCSPSLLLLSLIASWMRKTMGHRNRVTDDWLEQQQKNEHKNQQNGINRVLISSSVRDFGSLSFGFGFAVSNGAVGRKHKARHQRTEHSRWALEECETKTESTYFSVWPPLLYRISSQCSPTPTHTRARATHTHSRPFSETVHHALFASTSRSLSFIRTAFL